MLLTSRSNHFLHKVMEKEENNNKKCSIFVCKTNEIFESESKFEFMCKPKQCFTTSQAFCITALNKMILKVDVNI